MGTIVINGIKTIVDRCCSVIVDNNIISINGKKICGCEGKEVTIEGDVGSLKCTGNVKVHGNVTGNIDAGGSVQCNNVGGEVDSGGSVRCSKVGGSIDAGGSVSVR